ncbi:MAG: MerR family transcriptional regulator [Desulfobacterales bacterium]|nr:MerR family transcriptional regulator [Desulfobacterales bacterium]MDD4071464.1 MerR family transcriptional regulator [Desulfobacterales bacterium]MDD4393204.1 MerR family transcriptional regulator [Desulfobacterales bacterium]
MGKEVISQSTLPDKLYFRIGEVSKLSGIPAYVLRFWEMEFSTISPKRTPTGQRLYRKGDVERILQIKHLLYDKKYTIQGAKRYLRSSRHSSPDIVDDILMELKDIRDLLD